MIARKVRELHPASNIANGIDISVGHRPQSRIDMNTFEVVIDPTHRQIELTDIYASSSRDEQVRPDNRTPIRLNGDAILG